MTIQSVYKQMALALWGILPGLLLFSSLTFAQQGPSQLNISGGLYNPNGTPVTNGSVNFRLEVWDKNNTCVLYSEQHLGQDLSATKGGFSLEIGKGSSVANNIDAGSTTALSSKVFENPGAVAPFASCASGVTLASGDNRVIRVYYDLGSGYTAMSPDVPIGSSAYAMVAESLQGKRPADFIQVRDDISTDLNQTNIETIFSAVNFAKLVQILSGNFGGSTITNVGTPSAGTDATNKNYVDANIGGRIADVSTVGPAAGNGHTLIWDQAQNRWVTGTPVGVDNTKLPLAGGTMTGAIAMGGNNITNVGNISVAAQRTINLGVFTNAQEATLVAGLAAGDAGKFWYNTDVPTVKVWNGSAAVTQAYLSVGGKLDPAWIPDTAVTAGAYGSATQVPVFTVGADGRITGVTNTTISGVAPAGAAGGDLTGTYPNPTIANNAVTTVKINNDAITSAKINSTGIAVNRILITDATTGATVGYKVCALNESLMWTATGWDCVTVPNLLGNSGVTAATYGSATQVSQVSVDAQGRVTAAANVAIAFPVVSVAGKTGAVTLNYADIGGLGTAAVKDFGTAAGNLVELDAGGKIPVGLLPSSAGDIQDVVAGGGLLGGGSSGAVTLSVDTGTTTGKIVQMAASDKLPAVDGSDLTQINAVRLQTRSVAATAPTAAQVLTWNSTASQWEPQTLPAGNIGDITSVNSGTGLVGGAASGDATLAVDVGTTAGKIVQLDASAYLPAVDGRQLTNINAVQLQTRNVSATAPTAAQVLAWNASNSSWEPKTETDAFVGTVTSVVSGGGLLGGNITSTGTLSVDVGTTTGKIVQMAASDKLPAVDGSDLTQINAVRLQTRDVSSTAPTAGQVLAWNASNSSWEPRTDAGGSVASVTGGVGMTGGTITSSGTLNVDVGTTAGKIVQLDASAYLPAVDGRNLTNINAVQLQTRNVASTAPTANQILKWNAGASQWEPSSDIDTGITELTGDVTAGPGSGSVAATIGNDKITAAKINSTGIAVNRLLITDATTGANVTYAACNLNEILKWTATGWTCAPDAGGSGFVTHVGTGTGLLGGPITTTGTISIDVGTTTGKIVQMQASNKLPAVDGSDLTQINAVRLQARDVASTAPTAAQVLTWNASASAWEPQTLPAGNVGDITSVSPGVGLTGGAASGDATLSVDVGTTANKIVQLDSSARIPAVDGSLLTQVNAVRLQTRDVSSTAPTASQVLAWNASNSSWEPKTETDAFVGTVTSVVGGTGLLGGNITSSGTLAIDVGTTAGKIVQLDASANLPSVDGRNLTNINAVQLQTRNVASTAPTAAQVLAWNAANTSWEPQTVSVSSGGGFVQNGNSFGADATLGTNDNFAMNFETNGATAMTISTAGNVAIGAAPSASKFLVMKTATATSGSQTGMDSYIEANPTAASSAHTANYFGAGVTAGNTRNITGMIKGVYGQAWHEGTGTLTDNVGVKAESVKASTGPVTNLYGVHAHVQNNNATGAVTNGYGVYIADSIETGAITNDYGVYQVDTGAMNYFGGSIGINVTAPLEKLHLHQGSMFIRDGNAFINSNQDGTSGLYLFRDSARNTSGAQSYGLVYTDRLNTGGNHRISLNTAGVERIAVDSSGNVGIGTSSPSSLLHVNGVMRVTDICDENGANCKDISGGWGGGGDIDGVYTGTGLAGGFASGSGTLSVDVGTTANKIVQLDSSARLPAVNGSLLTNVNAVQLQTRNVSSTAPTASQVLAWNAGNSTWEPKTETDAFTGTVTSVVSGSGLTGGNITSTGTLAVDTGTTANKIVQLDASARLPAVNGNQLTNVNAVQLQTRNVASTAPTAGQILMWNAAATQWEPSAPSAAANSFVNGGNSFGGTATIGTNDNFGLAFETNGGTQLSILNNGDFEFGGSSINPARYEFFNNPWSQTSGTVITQSNYTFANGAAAGSAEFIGFHNHLISNRSGNQTGAIVGIYSRAEHNGSAGGANMATAKAGDFQVHVGSETVTNGYGIDVKGRVSNGTITNFHGVYVSPAEDVGTGAITNNYGVYIANQTAGSTSNFALYSAGGLNYLAGNTGIGTNNPQSLLHVNGVMRVTDICDENGANCKDVSGGWGGGGDIDGVYSGTGLTGGFASGSGTLSVDVGTTANKIVQLDSSARLPAVNGSLLTNINAVQLQTRNLSSTAPTASQVLAWNAGNSSWEPKTETDAFAGTVTSVVTGTGLTGGNITSTGTIAVDVGTTANKVVQLDSSARLPSVDGSQLTNVNAVQLQTRNVASTAPTAAQVLGWNAASSAWEPQTVSVSSGGGFINGGNSFGAAATLGTNDNFALNFEANGSTAMTILANGDVGIGTASPTTDLHLHTGGQVNSYMQFSNNTTGTGSLDGLWVGFDTIGANIWMEEASPMRFATSGVERIRIQPDGRVQFGTTSADPARLFASHQDTVSTYPVGEWFRPMYRFAVDVSPSADMATGANYSTVGVQGTAFSPATNVNDIDGLTGVAGFMSLESANINAGKIYGTYGQAYVPGAGNTIARVIGVTGDAQMNGNSTPALMAGVRASATPSAGTTTNLTSFDAFTRTSSSATATNSSGIQINVDQTGGTVTNMHGVWVKSAITGGTVTNRYGIKLDAMTGSATNQWAIHQSDATARSYFAGSVGIGVTNPLAPLHVSGVIRADQICDTAGANCKTINTGWGAGGDIDAVYTSTGLTGGFVSGSGTLAVDVGTTANKIVQLDSSARLPAVNGSQLTNVNAVQLQTRNVASTAPTASQVLAWNAGNSTWEPKTETDAFIGTVTSVVSGSGLTGGNITSTGTLAVDTGTTANKIVQLDASARIPAVNGSLLTNVNAVQLQTRNVASTAPTASQVLGWNAAASQWEPQTVSSGSATSFPAGTVANPGFSVSGDPDTGLLAKTTNEMSIAAGGVEVAQFQTLASAVNYVKFTPAATGNAPLIEAGGADTNVALNIRSKGTGAINLSTPNGRQFTIANGPASTVNQLSVQGSATGGNPILSAAGSDANVGITLTPKGSGDVTVTSGRVLAGTSGDVAAYAFTGMNTTGLGLYGTNNLALYQGGSRILNYWGGVMELQIPMQGASESVYLNPGVTGINSPSYTFRDYTGYGMGLDAAGSKLSLVAGGSSRMVATSTGNIGIGTTAPLETLDIRASDENGILVVRNTTSTAARTDHIRVENFTNGNGGAAGLNLQSYRGTNAAPAALNSGDVVGQIFFNGGKDASWGVGYGASIQATAAGNFTGTSAPTDLTFATTPTGNTAPTERIRITASGNVGVGTSSVNEKLTVEGVTSLRAVAAPTLTANYGKIYVDSGDSNKLKYMNPAGAVTDLTAGAGTAFVQNGNSFSGTATIGTNDAQSLVLETNNTAAVTIQSNGNIGLGYGSPSYAVHTQKTHSHTSGWVPMAFDYVWFSPGSAPAAGTHSIANYSAVETGGASSLSNATITGTVSHAKHSSTQQVNNSTGAYSWVENNSAGTINAAMGSNSEVVNDSAGTINSAIGSQGVITNSSGTMTSGMAVYGMVNNSASMTRGYGASFDVTNSSATNMTDLLGINAAVVNTASATVTTAIGYNTSLRNEGTGSMTTAIGLNATVANTGAGSIGTGYGVLIGNIAGTTKYGLYQSDATARNVMSGNLSVGTSNSHGVATIEGVTALRAVAAPTATANYGKVYVDSADSNKLKYMNPAGTVTDLTAGAGSAFVNGGNSFGANAVIGTNDSYNMSFEVNGTTRARITPSSGFTFLGSWAGGYTPSKTSGWDTNLDGITVENTTNSDNNGSQVELLVRNTAGTDQRAYIGAVSENTGYAPSIIFGQRSGNTAYDERMRITPSGNVGIGTSNPYQTFEVVRTNSDTGILVGNYGGATPRYPAMIAQNYIDTSGSGWPEFFGISSRGTAGTPAATQSGDVLAVFGGKGTYNTSYGSRMSAYMYIAASENHGASNGGGHMRFYTTNNGTTSATEKMRITDNGNVGVGTTAPAAQLHVSRADTDTSLIVENSSSTAARYPTIEIRNYRGASSGAPEFKTYIANGTASAPTAVTAWSVTGGMTFGGYDGTDAGASAAIYSWASENWTNSANGGEMSLYTTPNGTTGAVERIKISQNGNVGVGYNSPTSRLDVVGSAANGTLKISSSGTDASAKDAAITVRHYTNAEEPMSLIYANAAAAANSIYIGGGHASQNAATDISFLTAANSTTTSGTERMRIDSSGNVGIGTTAPSDKLHIAGGSLRIDNDTNTTNKGCIRFDGTAMQYSNDCTTYVNFASSTGGGWTDAGATMYTTTSTDNVGIGHASPLYKLHVVNTATTIPRGIVQDQISNDNSAALFGGRHARGTPGAPTAVANADFIASLGASPYDGSAWQTTGFAGFQVNGTVAAGSVPTDFIVHNGAAAGSLTEKLRLTSAGNLQVGNSAHEVFTNPPAISISKNVAPYISIGHWSNDLMMIGKDSTDFFTMASENTMGGIKFKVNGAFAATQFIDTATTAMTIDNLGEVGIGTTTPTSPLHVVATSTDTSGAPKANYYYYTANPGAASTATYYGSNGSVGKGSNANLAGATFVGVAGVAEQGGTGTLNNATGVEGFVTKYGTGNINNVNGIYSHVQSTTTGTISNYNGLLVNTNISSGTLTQAAGVRIEDLQATTGYGIYQEGTNDSNYFAGNVGIGATSPGAKLEVSGNATGLVRLNGPATTGYSGIEFHENSAVRWMMYQDSSTDRLQVGDGDNSHGVYMSQNVSGWTNYSDARLKEEVKDYSVLDKLEKFRAVTFKWKLTGTAGIGVIAQEVAQAFPEVVEQGDQDLNRGISSINDPGVWGVHYDHLAPIALQGVKEVHGLCKMTQEQMNALEARVSQTERDIASLKEENAQLKGQTAKLKTENADIKARLERLEKALSQGK